MVTVGQSSPSNGFYNVKYESTTGWSSGKYLQPSWSCDGSHGTTKMADARYYTSSFGCWVDSSGKAHSDPGDNCIPGCLGKLQAAGACVGMSGPQCERAINWCVADAGRYGCNTRLKLTNPANGRSAVVVVIDFGPACWVEKKVSKGVMDMSGRVAQYLYGGPMGATERVPVQVMEVSSSAPLGPTD